MTDKRVLITQVEEFMGPDLLKTFRAEGAHVLSDASNLRVQGSARKLIQHSGRIDVLIANLAVPQPRTSVLETTDEVFRRMFEALVFPLHELVQAVLPQMIERRAGKIVVMGSASALRGMPLYSAYGSARGAQLAYVQDVGVEVASHNVQINAIAQTFVDNATYFPASYQSTEEFRNRIAGAPIGRLAHGWESAALALFLAGGESDFFVGQTVPFAGGWVSR